MSKVLWVNSGYSLVLYENNDLKNIIECSTLDYMIWFILDEFFPGTTYKNYPEFPISNRPVMPTDFRYDYNKFEIQINQIKQTIL